MKKIIIIVVSILFSFLLTFVSFECLSWYHFGDIPTTRVALRFSLCFLIVIGIVLWIILKVSKKLESIKNGKLRFWVYFLSILFFILSISFGIFILFKDNDNFFKKYPFTVVISEFERTDASYLYTTLNHQKIYSNLEHIQIQKDNSLMELKDYLIENPNAIEEIINYMEFVDIYRDGGTKLYQDKDGVFTNEGFTVIRCNKMTVDSINTDIYIGYYETESSICENTRMIMVNDVLYYDTKEESPILGRCGTGMEEILYSVKGNETPTRNYESNFGTNYKFMFGMKENTIEVLVDNKWMIFEAR